MGNFFYFLSYNGMTKFFDYEEDLELEENIISTKLNGLFCLHGTNIWLNDVG